MAAPRQLVRYANLAARAIVSHLFDIVIDYGAESGPSTLKT
jgi:hypothetical protein